MDSTRLLAPGVPVSVAGVEVPVRFSLLAIKRLEDRYGSIGKAEAKMLEIVGSELERFPEPIIDDLLDVLSDATGLSQDEILNGFDGLPRDAFYAVWLAWAQAWPVSAEESSGKAEAEGGTGETSTTPQPSDGAATTTSSGG